MIRAQCAVKEKVFLIRRRRLAGICTAALLLSVFCADKSDKTTGLGADETNISGIDSTQMAAGLQTLADALASSSIDAITGMMTETTRELYGQDLSELSSEELSTIAKAFESAKLVSASPTLAEYSLTIDGLTYTIALTPGEKGQPWQLVRF